MLLHGDEGADQPNNKQIAAPFRQEEDCSYNSNGEDIMQLDESI